MRSNGSSVESSRRPTTRVMKSRKRYISAARITMSIGLSYSREAGQRSVDGKKQAVSVLQLHVGGMSPDGRRVRLELDVQDVALSCGNVPEVERERPVAARLADGARLDRVDRVPFEPALGENERGLLQLLPRGDREPGLPEEPAANPRRRMNLQIGLGARRECRRGSLPERVEEAGEDEEREQREQRPAHPAVPVAALHVAIAAELDPFRRVCHGHGFTASRAFPLPDGSTDDESGRCPRSTPSHPIPVSRRAAWPRPIRSTSFRPSTALAPRAAVTGAATGASKAPNCSTTASPPSQRSSRWSSGATRIGSSRTSWARST